MAFDPNEEEIPLFSVPDSVLEQFFELTGKADAYKGFILAYVNEEGMPMVVSKIDTQIVEMGLQKALEQFLEDTATARLEFPELGEE